MKLRLAADSLSLLRRALGRRVGRQRDPWMTRLLPYRDCRRRKTWVREVADSNGYLSRKAVVLPVQGGVACRTKMVGHRVAAFGGPHPLRRFTGECNLVEPKARLIADHGTSTALAR